MITQPTSKAAFWKRLQGPHLGRRIALSLWQRTLAKTIKRMEILEQYRGWGCDLKLWAGEGGGIAIQKEGRIILIAACHIQYAWPLVLQFDYFFSAVESDPVPGARIVDYRRPKIHQLRSPNVKFSFTSIAEDDLPMTGYIARYQPRLGDVVVDAGGYCGVSAYCFSRMVGESGHVFALEPDPANFNQLSQNIARHSLRNVTPLRLALSGRSGRAKFAADQNLGGHLSETGLAGTVEIETISLVDLSKQIGSPIALIKMDIEGAEQEVVESARDWLAGSQTHFAIASYHDCDQGRRRTWASIEPVFQSLRYQCETGFPQHLTTWATPPSCATNAVERKALL